MATTAAAAEPSAHTQTPHATAAATTDACANNNPGVSPSAIADVSSGITGEAYLLARSLAGGHVPLCVLRCERVASTADTQLLLAHSHLNLLVGANHRN
jgi:hypothetical protein